MNLWISCVCFFNARYIGMGHHAQFSAVGSNWRFWASWVGNSSYGGTTSPTQIVVYLIPSYHMDSSLTLLLWYWFRLHRDSCRMHSAIAETSFLSAAVSQCLLLASVSASLLPPCLPFLIFLPCGDGWFDSPPCSHVLSRSFSALNGHQRERMVIKS